MYGTEQISTRITQAMVDVIPGSEVVANVPDEYLVRFTAIKKTLSTNVAVLNIGI